MTEIRQADITTPLDPAAIRLRALEIVAEFWSAHMGTSEALKAAKTYAEWIQNGDGRRVQGYREDQAALVALAAAGSLDLAEARRIDPQRAGRAQAAADIREAHGAWSRTGKLPQSYLDGAADAAHIADQHAEGEPT